MDFSLSEFQREIQSLSEKLLSDYCTQPRLRNAEAEGYFDAELWTQLANAGLLGLALPEEVGGMAQDFETLTVLLEQLGRYAAPAPALSVLASASLPLVPFMGSASVRAALSALCTGEGVLTFALEEQGFGSDCDTSVEMRDGSAYLTGEKSRVPAGVQATDCWTLAKNGDELAVYLFSCNQQGVTRRSMKTTNDQTLAYFTLDSARAELVAEGEAVANIITAARQYQQAASAAMAAGLCEGMLALSSEHCSQRKQFGRPLGSFQAVAHQLADCYIDKECLRAASVQAACQLRDRGTGSNARKACLEAAYWTTEALHRVSHRCQQVHGGTGVDRDYPLFRYSLWARQIEMDLGGQNSLLAELGRHIAGEIAA